MGKVDRPSGKTDSEKRTGPHLPVANGRGDLQGLRQNRPGSGAEPQVDPNPRIEGRSVVARPPYVPLYRTDRATRDPRSRAPSIANDPPQLITGRIGIRPVGEDTGPSQLIRQGRYGRVRWFVRFGRETQ